MLDFLFVRIYQKYRVGVAGQHEYTLAGIMKENWLAGGMHSAKAGAPLCVECVRIPISREAVELLLSTSNCRDVKVAGCIVCCARTMGVTQETLARFCAKPKETPLSNGD